LIIRKIIKIVATRCQILRQKCTKFDFGWGSARGAYSVPPDPVAGFKGPTSKRREGKGGKGRGRRGRGGEGNGGAYLQREGGEGMEGKGRGRVSQLYYGFPQDLGVLE